MSIALYFIASPNSALAVDAIYDVEWDKKAETLIVHVEFHNKTAMQLSNYDRELSNALLSSQQLSKEQLSNGQLSKERLSKSNQTSVNAQIRGNRIRFEPAISSRLRYVVSVKSRGRYPYVFEQDSLVMPTHLWLWRNDAIHHAQFRFRDSRGKTLPFYLPFPKTEETWDLTVTPPGWTSRTLVGSVSHHPISLRQNRQINAVLLGSLNEDPTRWQAWLKDTATAVETGFDYFPVDKANILVIPTTSRNSPVPWGEVQRGGFPSVHFFIDASKSKQQFAQDWTASHEMSHLFVPKTSWRDRWLSEGIASYYQNVLRARGGILSAELAWQKMRQGFARGRRGFNHRSLRNVNQTMHLYWGGVAIYFLADLRLREAGSSLDNVLQGFNECCFQLGKTWTAEELMAQFDSIAGETLPGTSIFTELLENEAAVKQFPVSANFENDSNPLLKKHLMNILQRK